MTMLIYILKKRLPEPKSIFTVFGSVIFVVASWSVYVFLPHLTSYLFHYNAIEILSLFSLPDGFCTV